MPPNCFEVVDGQLLIIYLQQTQTNLGIILLNYAEHDCLDSGQIMIGSRMAAGWQHIPMLLALVISKTVVTICFLGLNNCDGVFGESSITKTASRSDKSTKALGGRSCQTVTPPSGLCLFQ